MQPLRGTPEGFKMGCIICFPTSAPSAVYPIGHFTICGCGQSELMNWTRVNVYLLQSKWCITCHTQHVALVHNHWLWPISFLRKMSSSSLSPTSLSEDHDGQQLAEAVDQSPICKMAEEFKQQMVQMVPPTACSKMYEDSQDSSQGQGSSYSRCLMNHDEYHL